MTNSNETWNCPEDGDYMDVTVNQDGTVYGIGNSFDFERETYEEAVKQLESWGYHKL